MFLLICGIMNKMTREQTASKVSKALAPGYRSTSECWEERDGEVRIGLEVTGAWLGPEFLAGKE